MKNKKTVCLEDVIRKLEKLPETLIRSDITGEKYVPSGHGYKFEKAKKEQTCFELKIKNKESYCLDSLYRVECNDSCGKTALLLYYHKTLKIDEVYKIHGYPVLDKDGNLIIISGEEYSDFETRLSIFYYRKTIIIS